MYWVDYHVHPNTFINGRYWPHNQPLHAHLEVCRQKGIHEIGFSEHGPRYHPTYNHTSLQMDDIPAYYDTLMALQETNRDIKIRVGLELDYAPEFESKWHHLKKQAPFDFLAGAVHFLPNWLPTPEGRRAYDKTGRTLEHLFIEYYQMMKSAARSQLFDFLAHPDLVKIHSILSHLPEPDIHIELWEEFCEVCRENQQVIEFDTGWKRHELDCYRPAPDFLEIARRYDIPITLGSDAHKPEDIGTAYESLPEILHQAGYTHVTTFHRHRATQHPIHD